MGLERWQLLVLIFPEMAGAALKGALESAFAVFAVLKAWDTARTGGGGFLERASALRDIQQALAVEKRQAQRILRAGNGTFWELTAESVRLYSFGRAATELGVDRVSTPRLVRTMDLVGAAHRRATLIATNVPVGEVKRPTTRRFLRAQTGVGPSTQRRLERTFGAVAVVSSLYLVLGRRGTHWYAHQVATYFRRLGFFSSGGGVLIRRLGDVRVAAQQSAGSASCRRRTNRVLAAFGRPAFCARGQRNPKVYFAGADAVKAWSRDKQARGHRSDRSVHPLLDYSVQLRRGRGGRLRAYVLTDYSASQVVGVEVH